MTRNSTVVSPGNRRGGTPPAGYSNPVGLTRRFDTLPPPAMTVPVAVLILIYVNSEPNTLKDIFAFDVFAVKTEPEFIVRPIVRTIVSLAGNAASRIINEESGADVLNSDAVITAILYSLFELV
jgi:hypothetical protein